MRKMTAEAARGNYTLTLKHIRGTENGIADALSRFQHSRFRQLAPLSQHAPMEIPTRVLEELRRSYQV